MEFSKQEHWSGLPFPTPGDLPNPRIDSPSLASLVSPALAADSLPLSHLGSPTSVLLIYQYGIYKSFSKNRFIFQSKLLIISFTDILPVLIINHFNIYITLLKLAVRDLYNSNVLN